MSTAPVPGGRLFLLAGFVATALLISARPTPALEVGEMAPDFSLTATTGGKVSLGQFRGKQPVLIEFYSNDFAPV